MKKTEHQIFFEINLVNPARLNYLCSDIYERSASFKRVCHPLPWPLKNSMTSSSSRTVVDILGLDLRGLPRIAFLMGSGISESENDLNSASSLSECTVPSSVACWLISTSSASVGKIVSGLSFGISSYCYHNKCAINILPTAGA